MNISKEMVEKFVPQRQSNDYLDGANVLLNRCLQNLRVFGQSAFEFEINLVANIKHYRSLGSIICSDFVEVFLV